jgi:hypothetical protein
MAPLKGWAGGGKGVWLFFLILCVSFWEISYGDASYLTKSWVFCLGILLTAVVSFAAVPAVDPDPETWKREFTEWLPAPWLVGAVLLAAVFLRFSRIGLPCLWPTGDESLHGFLGISLSQKWTDRFFYTVGEHPPLLIWLLAFFFGHFRSPFFDLWFFPALFSLAAVPLGYACVRFYFSKSLAFLLGLFLALGFWPLDFGRFCHQGVFIPFWELGGVWLLGRWMKSGAGGREPAVGWPAVLGLWTGLGTFTFTSWWTVLFLLAATVLILGWTGRLRRSGWFWCLLAAGLFPFGTAAWREGYGHHLVDSAGMSHWFTPTHLWLTHLSYLTSLFGGALSPDASYGPSWGGMLDPVLGAGFGVGCLELYRHRTQGLARWIAAGLVVCLSPAFLAGDYVEMNRIIQAMPFLLLVSCLGFHRLARETRGRLGGRAWMGSLLCLSLVLGWIQWAKPVLEKFSSAGAYRESALDPAFRAFRTLKSVAVQRGPGLLFTDFLPLAFGHSLYVTTYSFNAAANPEWDPARADWAAILTNVDYQPFLARRFPGSHWYWYREGPPPPGGGLTLGVVEVTGKNRPLFQRWCSVQKSFHRLNLEAEGGFNSPDRYEKSLEDFKADGGQVEGDPFLEAVYWEWGAQYDFGPSGAGNLQALEKAVRLGYPAAQLYRKEAVWLLRLGRGREAAVLLRKADRNEPRFHTDSRSEITAGPSLP